MGQLDLDVEVEFADLLEEQRTAVGSLEVAFVLRGGAGERALLVVEEFGFDQGLGDRAAVHRHERAIGAHLVAGVEDVAELRRGVGAVRRSRGRASGPASIDGMNSAEMLKGTEATRAPCFAEDSIRRAGKRVLARMIHTAAIAGVPGLRWKVSSGERGRARTVSRAATTASWISPNAVGPLRVVG